MSKTHNNNFYKKAIERMFYIVDMEMSAVPFKLNPPQEKINSMLSNMDIVLKARQEGISSLISARFLIDWLTVENVKCVIISHEQKATQRLFDRVRYFLESLKNNWPGELPYKLKYNSRHEIVNLEKNSVFYIGTAAARAFGRGDTINNLHISELAMCEEQERLMVGLLQAVPKDGKIVIESTANGIGDYFYKICIKARSGNSPFKFHFLPWFDLPTYIMPYKEPMELISEEQNLMNRYGLNRNQIAWRRWKINQMNGDWTDPATWDKFAQEFPSNADEAFIVSGNPVWSPNLIKFYLTRTQKPILRGNLRGFNPVSVEPNEKGYLKVWKEPNEFHTYAIGCLPDGEKVLTNDGYKNIELVGAENSLVNAIGEKEWIVNFQRRFYKGNIYETKPYFTASGTKFTPEHPIQVLKDIKLHRLHKGKRFHKNEVVWKKAKNITKDDVLRFPILYKEEMSQQAIVFQFPDQKDFRIDRRIDKKIILKEDFWFFMGLWLAEGWIRNGGDGELKEINIVLNGEKEKELADRIIQIIKTLFNRKVVYQNRRGVFEIKFSCEALYRFIKENFGQKACGKYISEWIKYLPQDLKLAFFQGYFLGDGCIKTDKGKKTINCVSISERLLNDFQDILLSLGIIASVKLLRIAGVHYFPDRKQKCFTKKTFELNISCRDSQILFDKWGINIKNKFNEAKHKTYGWIEGDYFYLKIHKIESAYFEGWVNNFETSTHSYCARFITTHNCDVATGMTVNEQSGSGREKDYSCAIVFDKTTYEQVAVMHGHFDPDRLGRNLDLLGRYYNEALIGVERNAVGITPLIVLRDLSYPNLYYREKLGLMADKLTDELGWVTTAQSKEDLIAETTMLLRDKRIQIYDEETLSEMMSFVRDIDGHAKASKSAFDDRVIAAMIGIRMLAKARSTSFSNEIEREDYNSPNKGFVMGGQTFDQKGMPIHPDSFGGDIYEGTEF